MPRHWYDRHTVNTIEDEDEKEFQRSIVADKKPYFMRYIYPDLMKQYNTYIKNTNRNALREFQMTVSEMMALPAEQLTERQMDFLRYYRARMPVGVGDCVMNKICRKIEAEFDGFLSRSSKSTQFDYTIMRTGSEYTYAQKTKVQSIYDEYVRRAQELAIASDSGLFGSGEKNIHDDINQLYRDMYAACSNESKLYDILLDVCYKKNSSKQMLWNMLPHEIITHLLEKNGYTMTVPVRDDSGDIEYCGEKFAEKEVYFGGLE